jgi:hypothetical protein
METPEAGRLLGRFLLAALVLLAGAALGGGLAHLKFRWLIPAFFPLPLYAFWRIAHAPVEGGRLRRYALLLLIVEALLVCGFALRVRFGGLVGHPSELTVRYGVVARQLASAGFHDGTAVVGPGRLAGNLRPWFPGVRVISLESPAYVPPPTADAACLVIWQLGSAGPGAPPGGGESLGRSVPPALQVLLGSALDGRLSGDAVVRTVDVPYRYAPGRVHPVHYILLPEGTGRCR